MWPCKGNGIGVSMPQWLHSTAGFLLKNGYVSGPLRKKVWCCVVQLLGLFIFPIVPLPGSFFYSISLLYFLLLICCFPSSLSLLLSYPCPLCVPLRHPGGPSFHHRFPSPHLPLAPPVCKAGVSQDKEDSNYLTKEATGSSRQKTHAHIHTHVLSLSLSLCYVLSPSTCTSHIYAPFLSLIQTHIKLLWAGLGLGTGRAGAVCLSVISIPAGGSWPGQTSEWSSRSR